MDQLLPVRERQLKWRAEHVDQLKGALLRAQHRAAITATPSARQTVYALHSKLNGLMQNGILELVPLSRATRANMRWTPSCWGCDTGRVG